MRYNLQLAEAFQKTTIGLDGIIEALTYPPEPSPHPETIVEYADGSISSFNIEGELGQNSIPDKVNAIKVEIGSKVTSIGDHVFSGCSSLTSITIPNGVTSIGFSAFYSCSGLTSITIPDGVTSIGDGAFVGCSGLTSISIPDSVTSIGNSVFFNCSGLTSITIGNGVTSIESSAFQYCSGLTSIIVDQNNLIYDSRNNCNAIIVTSINELIAGCKNTMIPSSVTSIGNYAFYGCSGLMSITIPDSVTSIGINAFYGCSGLTSVVIPNSVTNIGSSAFSGCSGLTSITIPDSVTNIGSSAFFECSKLSLIICQATTAPTVQSRTFGTNSSSYTGRNTYSTGNNVLKVPQGATGYDSGAWLDPLQNAEKCGFHIEYLD